MYLLKSVLFTFVLVGCVQGGPTCDDMRVRCDGSEVTICTTAGRVEVLADCNDVGAGTTSSFFCVETAASASCITQSPFRSNPNYSVRVANSIDALSVWNHLVSAHRVVIRPKAGDSFMEEIATWLGNEEQFMTQYATTIGSTIYVPDITSLDPVRQITLAAHEFQHVLQQADGARSPADYLLSTGYRAHVEAQATLSEIELLVWLTGTVPTDITVFSQDAEVYGYSVDEVRQFEAELVSGLNTIRQHGIVTESGRLLIAFLEETAPQLRRFNFRGFNEAPYQGTIEE